MKQKIFFTCNNCTYKSIKWLGCCPECKEWQSFREQKAPSNALSKEFNTLSSDHLVQLNTVELNQTIRMHADIEEWDRVMGNGIMPSSLIVLTGDPGIGKSTLLLQVSNNLARHLCVHYFSTEESLEQVKQRADRLGKINDKLLFSDQANLEIIIATAQQQTPDILIIDSIQNCYIPGSTTLPGSTGQLRESIFHLMRLAKEHKITIILTGHITKEGVIAGPKILEHMVDAVFYLQGEDQWHTRVLRAVKNRFGPINELGFFEMHEHGLQEVPNINEYLLNDISYSPGSVLISIMEGSRPLLLELQALTIETKLTMPLRVISGVDHKQVVLIAAILEKYLKIRFSAHDIFFKVSGGFKVKESATDLGIALALLSSYFQQPLPEHSIALGEISLTGHIKPINSINIFIQEAKKFGIRTLLVAHKQKIERSPCILRSFKNVYDLLSLFSENSN